MEELNQQVTQTQEQTQQVTQPAEENLVEQNVEQVENKTLNENPLEEATTEVKPQEDITTTPTEVKPQETTPELSDDIKQKLERLKEYELNNKELENLRNKLGVQPQEDNQIFSAKQQLAIVENQVQQDYIKLCNAYGVDFRPEKIEESAALLKEKDPQAYYELDYKLRGLSEIVNNKRAEVQNFIRHRDTEIALSRNAKILQASPAINKVVQDFISQGRVTGQDIDMITSYGMDIAREAIEIGKQLARQEYERSNTPAKVLNNNSIVAQTQVSSSNTSQPILTLADVERMSVEEYAKNKELIDKLIAENKLM